VALLPSSDFSIPNPRLSSRAITALSIQSFHWFFDVNLACTGGFGSITGVGNIFSGWIMALGLISS